MLTKPAVLVALWRNIAAAESDLPPFAQTICTGAASSPQRSRTNLSPSTMSLKLDVLLRDNHTAVLNVPKTPARAVEEQLRDATERMQALLRDDYNTLTVLSLFWESDDTRGKLDSDLFLATMSEYRESTKTVQQALHDQSIGLDVTSSIADLTAATSLGHGPSRNLFVLHYAGHGWGSADALHLCPQIQDPDVDELESDSISLSFTPVKDSLKEAAKARGFDVLFVMDCCCAAIGGRMVRRRMKGPRVEFVAATTGRGIINSRDDGQTFTMAWCEGFNVLKDRGAPFTVDGVRGEMCKQKDLAQFPAIIIIAEGIDLPITFRPTTHGVHPGTVHPATVPAPPVPVKTVIAAFHLSEDPGSQEVRHLTEYFTRSPVNVSVLAALASNSTWLLLRFPSALQDFLNVVPTLILQEE